MGVLYDEHRFLLYQGSTIRDITNVVSDPTLRDELQGISVEVSFKVLRNDRNDRFAVWPQIRNGDKLRIVNHQTEVFAGIILNVGVDGSVRANDPGWHLSRSQIILQLSNAAAPLAVAKMCEKAGVPAGVIDLPPTRITKVWWGATPESILTDILTICSVETGKTYLRRVRGGRLTVYPQPETCITLFHRPAPNVGYFDVSLAKGAISGSDSAEELINSVILTEQSDSQNRILGRASNPDSIARFGLLQQVEQLSGDETPAQARQRIKNMLEQGDRIKRERTIDQLFGDDRAVSGALVRFADGKDDVSGPLRIVSVTHSYGSPHTMSVSVRVPEPRAAGNRDTFTV